MLAAALALVAGASRVLPRPESRQGREVRVETRYPYRSAAFSEFISDSYAPGSAPRPGEFYEWFETAYGQTVGARGAAVHSRLEQDLEAARARLRAAKAVAPRAEIARKLGAELHRAVKRAIPRFSLDRGFEFRNVVAHGERQCFLQAVLLAGLLQKAGLEAGVVMVSRNPRGVDTNNGHAATLLSLADGTAVIVDASDPEPFARQQGLFVEAGGYRYVYPQFRGDTPIITGYRGAGAGTAVLARKIEALDTAFIRSQFDFYRGERAPGGLLSARPTTAGLRASERFLLTSVRWCPENPLAVYSLGRLYLKQKRHAEAATRIRQAVELYRRAGWVPTGPRDLLARFGQVNSASDGPPASR